MRVSREAPAYMYTYALVRLYFLLDQGQTYEFLCVDLFALKDVYAGLYPKKGNNLRTMSITQYCRLPCWFAVPSVKKVPGSSLGI